MAHPYFGREGRMGMVFKKDGREGRPSEKNGRYPSLNICTSHYQKRKGYFSMDLPSSPTVSHSFPPSSLPSFIQTYIQGPINTLN